MLLVEELEVLVECGAGWLGRLVDLSNGCSDILDRFQQGLRLAYKRV